MHFMRIIAVEGFKTIHCSGLLNKLYLHLKK